MKPKSFRVPKFYLDHSRRYPRYLFGVIVSIPFTVLINNYLPPLIVSSVLQKLSSHHYRHDQLWPVFGHSLVGYAVLLLVGIATWRIVDALAWRLEARVQRDIAEEVFDHMVRQTADFHANNFAGSLVSQNSKLLGGYIRTADTTMFNVYPLIIGLVLTSIILHHRAGLFVLVLDLFAVSYMGVALWISRRTQKASSAFAAAESVQTGFLADAITNIMNIKSFARGNYERTRFEKATNTTFGLLFEFAKAHRHQMNRLGIMGRLIGGSALTLAVVSVIIFNADIGVMFLILSFTARIVDQLFEFSNTALRNYARAWGDATDMVDVLAKKPTILDSDRPDTRPIEDGSIVFNEVTFKHAGANNILFDKLTISVKQGEKVGLVGHSGSGKTTFTRLLLRFSDIQDGEIIVGGRNIAEITQDSLHNSIAYVPQEPLLFHRTIAENIGYGKEHATTAEIKAAADVAHASEFITTLPKGYETLVGERGVKLSGGQRQRIAIARAMLKNAPILVLDEATSALDSESEVLIQDALWKLMEGRTAIVIAHRLSTIQKMDRIVVLDQGKIVEQGSHNKLLKLNGTYAKLWAHQSGGFIEE